MIETFHEDPKVSVAYIYCNFQRQQDQKAEQILANLLKQLVSQQDPLPGCVESLYVKLERKKKRPSLEDLSQTFQLVAAPYSRAFIVVDALDECDDADGSRTKLLNRLFDMQSKVVLNLFVTSRFIQSIEQRFEGLPSVVIRPSRHDVFNFLDNHMFKLPDFVRRDESLQDEVKTEIESAIEGV